MHGTWIRNHNRRSSQTGPAPEANVQILMETSPSKDLQANYSHSEIAPGTGPISTQVLLSQPEASQSGI